LSASAAVQLGAVAPLQLQMVVSAGSSGVNLATVTAASFSVRGPNQAVVTWTATMSAQSADVR
jgi:hypothetical protein